MERGKSTPDRSLPHAFAIKNNNVKDIPLRRIFLQNNNDAGEFSGQNESEVRDSVDNIIKKYKDQRLNKTCYKLSNQNLKSSLGEREFTQSVHNFYHYVEPKYFLIPGNKSNHLTVINSNFSKQNPKVSENVRPKVSFEEKSNLIHKNMQFCEETDLTSREKLYADKTTYCRPVTSFYTEEYIYKTMEKNSKLKRLIKRLAIARQREKESVGWNNYINELKNKHNPTTSCNDYQWKHSPQPGREQYITSDIIDDYYNTRLSWQQSRPCRNFLHDFYEEYYEPPQQTYNDRRQYQNNPQIYSNRHSLPYHTDSYCYPTASQGRITILERERQRNEYLKQWHNPLSRNNFSYVNNHLNTNYYKRHENEKKISKSSFLPNNNNSKACIESCTVQTDNFKENILKNNKATNNTENVLIDKVIQTFERNKNVDDTHQNTESIKNPVTLVYIENKLDTLIDCINNFIDEIKSNRKSKRKTKVPSVKCEQNNIRNSKNITSSTDESARRDSLVSGEIINNSSESTMTASNFYPCAVPKASEIDEILREIDKFCSKDRLLKSQPCSVNITIEVPTRDCSTEVTKSLSKHHAGDKVEIIEEISTPEHPPTQQMTIAVNTDPFNFLSLLRISTEALMRFLSHVPNINYHSYLAFLPFPQMTRKVESHYICNICGAAFAKPSALSDHIQKHNLGKTRDCCVCRHVLDLSSRLPNLFKCQFCGQRFTRAYCCELHQRGCARRLGQPYDVASSLMLLR